MDSGFSGVHNEGVLEVDIHSSVRVSSILSEFVQKDSSRSVIFRHI